MTNMLRLTADIVSAYVAHHQLPQAGIPALIASVHKGLLGEPEVVPQVPAVPIRRSVTPDYLICLEDGTKRKSLKRYLFQRYSLTPDQYRRKWGLPHDYPMVAPNYAKARSDLAKQIGLGTGGRGSPGLAK